MCVKKKLFLNLAFGLLVKDNKQNDQISTSLYNFYTGRRIFKVKNFTRGRGFCIWGKDHGFLSKSHTFAEKTFGRKFEKGCSINVFRTQSSYF